VEVYYEFRVSFRFHYCLGAGISVGIAARLRAGLPRSRVSIPGRGERIFSLFSQRLGQNMGSTRPPVGTGDCLPKVLRQGCEVDHSSLYIIKNSGVIPLFPLNVLMAWYRPVLDVERQFVLLQAPRCVCLGYNQYCFSSTIQECLSVLVPIN
jgi:hypothetical protein